VTDGDEVGDEESDGDDELVPETLVVIVPELDGDTLGEPVEVFDVDGLAVDEIDPVGVFVPIDDWMMLDLQSLYEKQLL